ncbi:MAG: ABC transporter permease subunit [Chloroflexi bacterium]|nr:ABC transporter permease subunit [Chloroflexota bacterium]
MNRADFFAKWSSLHGNAEIKGIVKAWLKISYGSAKLASALRITPNLLTLLGIIFAIAMAVNPLSLWTIPLLVLSLYADGIDGSVAIYQNRASQFGAVLDSVADRVSEALWFYVLISPWIAGFILFSGGPTIASAYLSLTHNDPVNWPPTWVGLLNYDVMFRDRLFWKSLQVTTYYTVLSVPLSVGFATFLALILNEKLPGMAAWRTIYYLPSIVTGVPVALMWNWIFQPQFGLVNGLLYDLGVPSSMLPKWLSDPQWAVPTFVIMSLWQFGGPMLIYLASIQGVPTQLYESAQLDGASKFRQIWHITLPSISPVIFFNGILAIISSFQVFTNAFVITQGGPNYATYFMVFMIYQNAFTYISNMGYADALAWVLFVIMLAFTAMAFRLQRHWVFYEAVVR